MVMSSKWMRLIGLVGFTAVLVSCKQTPQAPMNANYATMKITVSDIQPRSVDGRISIFIHRYPELSSAFA